MANNLFVSYDLMAPGQHYQRVSAAIEGLGTWGKVELSFYYVNTRYSADEAAKIVWGAMTANDKLMVVDASNNKFSCFNILPEVLKQMQDNWNR